MTLRLKDINVKVEDKEIIKKLSLELKKGEIAAIMGPNGSGKSSLANAIMGHPSYSVKGSAKLLTREQNIEKLVAEHRQQKADNRSPDSQNEIELLDQDPDERSKAGVFLSFQYPVAVPGVTVSQFIRQAINSRRPKENPIKLPEYVKLLNKEMKNLHIDKEFAARYLNEGFSGGEKKKMEILQMAMLKPKVAILDETDSGLDIDALKKVCEAINIAKKENPEMAILVITHYQRMLNYLKPDTIHVMLNGQIVKTGGPELAETLEKDGYEAFRG